MSQELVQLWMKQDPYLLDPEGLQAFLEQQMPKQIKQEEKLANLQPIVLLEKILQEIHHETHENYSSCWNTLVELIAAADFKGLQPFPLPAISTTTQHKDLMDKCHYMLLKYVEKARINPDDHLGELWNKMEIRGNDGQCLTPMTVCDMMVTITIGEEPKEKRIQTVLET